MKKLIYAAFAAMVLSLFVTAYSEGIENDLERNVLRLHIIANSDSEADQAIKLAVRDAVLSQPLPKSPAEAAQSAAHTAEEVLRSGGFDYGARGEYTKMYFPTKEYGPYTFPEGDYRAVRIILGSGEGHNWWCVLSPPVCMADGAEADAMLKSSVSGETYEVVTGGRTVKLRAVELLGRIRRFIEGR